MGSSKSSIPSNHEIDLKKMRLEAMESLKSSMPSNHEIELVIRPDGTVESAWWTPETSKLLCGVCGKQDSTACITCLNTNQWCG